MRGAGLPNVFLTNGYRVDEARESTSYEDVDGLLHAITRAVAKRSYSLTAAELKFLRKRLRMTQDQIGALGGKTGQIAAQWEKGQKPVPVAESALVRLTWLARHAKRELANAVLEVGADSTSAVPCDYVFIHRENVGWAEDIESARVMAQAAASDATDAAIAEAIAKSTVTLSSINAPAGDMPLRPDAFEESFT
jgi:DNA-binding transcriptional regulator YiaG